MSINKMGKPDSGALQIVLRRIMRFASDYGGIPLLVVAFGGIFALMVWFLRLALNGTTEAIGTLDDPTERGLAYIAGAVVLHAFFGRSNVDVKVDGKKP